MRIKELYIEVLKRLSDREKDVLVILKAIDPSIAFEKEKDVIRKLLNNGFIDEPLRTSDGMTVINITQRGIEYCRYLESLGKK